MARQVGYDQASRIANQAWPTSPVSLKGRFYTYDALGRLQLGENKTTTAPLPSQCYDVIYGYPICPQETWTPVAGESNTYSYDAVGNRTDKGGSYLPGSNRISAFAGWTYTTDLDGNTTNRDSTGVATVFTWNAEGQLTGTTRTGQPSVTNYYNANGRLVRKDLNGAASSYLLWEGGNLLAEFGANALTKSAEYSYWDTDRLHALIQPNGGVNTAFYAHEDGLGNTIALTNAAGSATARTYQYDDWGRLTGGTNFSLPLTDKDRARWKGALWLGPETESYFMRNRWFEAAAGRFLSEDPIGLMGGMNPFVYTASDPINGSDPAGLERCETYLGHDGGGSDGLDVSVTSYCRSGLNLWNRLSHRVSALIARVFSIDYGLWQYLEDERTGGIGAAPNVCGGGIFGYLGTAFKVRGNLGGEFLALGEYDTSEGGTWGFLAGGVLGGATVGGEWLRHDGAWHSSPIVLAGAEASTARRFVGKTGVGLLFSPHSFEAFDVGFYAGGVVGGGGYLSLSVGACQ